MVILAIALCMVFAVVVPVFAWKVQTMPTKKKRKTKTSTEQTNIGVDISAMTKGTTNTGTHTTSISIPAAMLPSIQVARRRLPPTFPSSGTISISGGGQHITFSGGTITGPTFGDEYRAADLPERDDDEPIGAFKLATLCWAPGGLRLQSLNEHTPHRRLARASCTYRGCSSPPTVECTCGFYALKDRESALTYGHPAYTALLEVELSGRVIVHTEGYRAEWQRIVHIEVRGGCFICGRPPTLLVVHEPRNGYEDDRKVTARCAEHVTPNDLTLPATVVGIPISFVPDDDVVFGFPGPYTGS